MIPLSDDVPSRRFPLVTTGLIVVNVLCFLYEVSLGPGVDLLIRNFGALPLRLVTQSANPLVWLTLLTSMYLHGGWAHLIGNMLYLWIFGDNVEDRMGRGRFFAFYTLCGLLSGLAQVLAAPRSPVPAVGASGAIAGVLGAYLLLFPKARVRTLITGVVFYTTIYLPAVVVLGGWFVIQFLNGLMTLDSALQTSGVAWWAHIGGFVVGMALLPLFRDPHSPPSGARKDGDWFSMRR